MKNKIGLPIIVMVLIMGCALSTEALAECDRHPDAPVYFESGVGYTDEGYSDCHLTHYWRQPYCTICDEYAGTGGDIYDEQYESHKFRSNVCTKCGYRRAGGSDDDYQDNDSYTDKPNRDELQQWALNRGSSAIGCTATVRYGGNVRSEPSEWSALEGKVYEDNSFQILDYYLTNKPTVWYQIQYYGRTVWISASLVEVDGSGSSWNDYSSGDSWSDDSWDSDYDSYDQSSADSWLIGRQCVITVSSGRARYDAGTQYGIVEYVHRGEAYTIIDVKTGGDGNTWYGISVDGNHCWIASSIARTN